MTKLRETLIYIVLSILAIIKFAMFWRNVGAKDEKAKIQQAYNNAVQKKNSINNNISSDPEYINKLLDEESSR